MRQSLHREISVFTFNVVRCSNRIQLESGPDPSFEGSLDPAVSVTRLLSRKECSLTPLD
jgi:hypothetical protein